MISDVHCGHTKLAKVYICMSNWHTIYVINWHTTQREGELKKSKVLV